MCSLGNATDRLISWEIHYPFFLLMLPLLPFDSLYNVVNCKAATFKGYCRLNAI